LDQARPGALVLDEKTGGVAFKLPLLPQGDGSRDQLRKLEPAAHEIDHIFLTAALNVPDGADRVVGKLGCFQGGVPADDEVVAGLSGNAPFEITEPLPLYDIAFERNRPLLVLSALRKRNT
jgi:hypothetical protein